jgi:glycosyltransferase involved in cell wall biosynthesis
MTLDRPDAPWVADFPIPVHALGRRPRPIRTLWGKAMARWGYSPHVIPWLRANAGRYDAIIINGVWNYAPFAASRVLPGGPVPYFVFTHGMVDPWFRRAYPLKHLAKQAFWLVGEGRLLKGATSVLFTCEEERRKARGQFWGHGGYTETVVGYGASAPPARTDELDRAFRNAVPALGDRPYLLFLSRIHAKKGCDLLIEAFARVAAEQPHIDLVMAGPDQTGWRSDLEALAGQRGVSSRIHWTGPIYGAAKWGALYGADAFVLTSHSENFGIAVAEALGCGTPVVISDKVDIWREIEAAGAGIIETDTAEGAERSLRRWFSTTEDERATMSRAAVEVFRNTFDVAQTGPGLVDKISKLIGDRAAPEGR